MQINQSTLAALYKGYRTLFEASLHGAAPEGDALYMRTPSGSAEEVYHWLGAVPGMKELVGEIAIENLGASNWTIANKEFESTVGVKQANIERDTYGLYNPLFQAMGQAAGEHPDELLADLLSNGFTTGIGNDYTGKAFFALAKKHEPNNSKSLTFDNKSTTQLAASSFSTARATLRGLKNSKGRPMGLGKKLLLVVSPENEDTAKEILVADRNAAGGTNIYKGAADILVLSRLTGPAWFLVETGRAVKPFIFQDEKKVALNSLTSMDSDHVFKFHEFLYQSYGRYNAGYGLPQLIHGSTGADAP